MVRNVKWLAASFLALATTTACTSSNLPVSSVAAANASIAEGYRVGAGDKLKITVFDEETLSGEYEVGDGGSIALPLIETIEADNKTANEISGMIAQKLVGGGFVLDPRVAVEIITYRPFFILGEVAEPGEYPYSGGLTLEQAIAKAGGYTPRAEKRRIELRRHHWNSARQVELDGQSLQIAPGDTITVLESFF